MGLREKSVKGLAAVLVALVLTGCSGGSYAIRSGGIDVFKASMGGAYKSFSGEFFKELKLEKGQVLRFCLEEETGSGSIEYLIRNKAGDLAGSIRDGFIWQVPEDGSYRIVTKGDKHAGSFDLAWIVETDGDPLSAVPMEDVEAFVVEMLSTDMTQAQESELIHQLQFVDWGRLSGMEPGRDPAAELMDWLLGLEMEKKLDRLPYLYLMDGMDGAYAEGYSVLMGSLLLEDPERFVACLRCMNEETVDRVAAFAVFHVRYQQDESYRGKLENLKGDSDEFTRRVIENLLVE